MAILWVYLPRYSTTCFGPRKGSLAYTTHFRLKSFRATVCGITTPLLRSSFTNFARKTFASALDGNKYLPSLLAVFHFRLNPIPPPGIMQCRCGCKLRFCPQVCNTAVIPVVAPKCLWSSLNCLIVLLADRNKLLYTSLGWCIANSFKLSGRVKTTWK